MRARQSLATADDRLVARAPNQCLANDTAAQTLFLWLSERLRREKRVADKNAK